MNTPANLVEKTLWWTKWQTWFAGLGVLLAVVFGWSTVKGILVATWAGLSAGVRIPVWLILLISGGVVWALWHRRGSAVPSDPPVAVSQVPARPEEATVGAVLWRWWPDRRHGRVGHLKAFCPKCDLELEWHESPGAYIAAGNWTTTLVCLRCPDIQSSFETRAERVLDVTRKIIEAGLRKEEEDRG